LVDRAKDHSILSIIDQWHSRPIHGSFTDDLVLAFFIDNRN